MAVSRMRNEKYAMKSMGYVLDPSSPRQSSQQRLCCATKPGLLSTRPMPRMQWDVRWSGPFRSPAYVSHFLSSLSISVRRSRNTGTSVLPFPPAGNDHTRAHASLNPALQASGAN